jgi:hypothetical protein
MGPRLRAARAARGRSADSRLTIFTGALYRLTPPDLAPPQMAGFLFVGSAFHQLRTLPYTLSPQVPWQTHSLNETFASGAIVWIGSFGASTKENTWQVLFGHEPAKVFGASRNGRTSQWGTNEL